MKGTDIDQELGTDTDGEGGGAGEGSIFLGGGRGTLVHRDGGEGGGGEEVRPGRWVSSEENGGRTTNSWNRPRP